MNGIAAYFFVGLIVLIVLDILTGRIRKGMKRATAETQLAVATTGTTTGHKVALAITLLAVWLFWPVAIYGAIEGKLRRK